MVGISHSPFVSIAGHVRVVAEFPAHSAPELPLLWLPLVLCWIAISPRGVPVVGSWLCPGCMEDISTMTGISKRARCFSFCELLVVALLLLALAVQLGADMRLDVVMVERLVAHFAKPIAARTITGKTLILGNLQALFCRCGHSGQKWSHLRCRTGQLGDHVDFSYWIVIEDVRIATPCRS